MNSKKQKLVDNIEEKENISSNINAIIQENPKPIHRKTNSNLFGNEDLYSLLKTETDTNQNKNNSRLKNRYSNCENDEEKNYLQIYKLSEHRYKDSEDDEDETPVSYNTIENNSFIIKEEKKDSIKEEGSINNNLVFRHNSFIPIYNNLKFYKKKDEIATDSYLLALGINNKNSQILSNNGSIINEEKSEINCTENENTITKNAIRLSSLISSKNSNKDKSNEGNEIYVSNEKSNACNDVLVANKEKLNEKNNVCVSKENNINEKNMNNSKEKTNERKEERDSLYTQKDYVYLTINEIQKRKDERDNIFKNKMSCHKKNILNIFLNNGEEQKVDMKISNENPNIVKEPMKKILKQKLTSAEENNCFVIDLNKKSSTNINKHPLSNSKPSKKSANLSSKVRTKLNSKNKIKKRQLTGDIGNKQNINTINNEIKSKILSKLSLIKNVKNDNKPKEVPFDKRLKQLNAKKVDDLQNINKKTISNVNPIENLNFSECFRRNNSQSNSSCSHLKIKSKIIIKKNRSQSKFQRTKLSIANSNLKSNSLTKIKNKKEYVSNKQDILSCLQKEILYYRNFEKNDVFKKLTLDFKNDKSFFIIMCELGEYLGNYELVR